MLILNDFVSLCNGIIKDLSKTSGIGVCVFYSQSAVAWKRSVMLLGLIVCNFKSDLTSKEG